WEQTVAALPYAIKRILAIAFKIIPISPRKCKVGLWGTSLKKLTMITKMKFYTVGDIVITEDEIKALIKGSEGVYKPVEAYLLANPEAYN
ncbi:hypothetical protein Goshw_000936, partial [Gossypium schwendimanii]|nr:hypothetical protein [Gossypium schwendimanii]